MTKKLPPQFEITIEALKMTGEGMGYLGKRPILVFGALPEDRVLLRPLRVGRREAKAELIDVISPGPFRREFKDNHFTSSSPWQIMLEEKQLEYKKILSENLFKKKVKDVFMPSAGITASHRLWNYRNKMEFSFTDSTEKGLVLAFFERERRNRYLIVENCAIAHEKINTCARGILELLRAKGTSCKALKSLIVRYSYKENQCVAVLYVTDENFPVFDTGIESLTGWLIIYSDPLSPFSKVTKILHKQGRDYLIEEELGLQFKFYYDSFFQIHPLAFEDVLRYIKEHTAKGGVLVDLYAGVGTIGQSLASQFSDVISIEFDEKASQAAQDNIMTNRLKNVTHLTSIAEKMDLIDIFSQTDVLITDPPRCGLHPKVTQAICHNGPKHFIYVSCNPKTQAQDLASLKEKYRVQNWQLFDMYPQTPHVESVLIMQRI